MENIDIKDLPEYLRSVRNNTHSESVVVGVGNIVQKKNNWLKPTLVLFCFLLIGSVTTYKVLEKEITIVSGADIASISDMVAANGGRIIDIEQENNTYKVKLITFRNINSFLDRLRSNKTVDSANIR